MTTPDEDFHSRYIAALLTHLTQHDEASLAVGYELGRQALLEQISMLEIIENHFRLVDELAATAAHDGSALLHFLLQTLVPLDVATRGFLDGTRRYAEQRARAEDLADRDAPTQRSPYRSSPASIPRIPLPPANRCPISRRL